MVAAAVSRRELILQAAGGLLIARSALAAEDPCLGLKGQTIDWIVPFSAGGGFDVYSRLLKPALEAEAGASIAVRNTPGAGGLIGSKAIRDAVPDGRTLGIVNGGGLLVARMLESDDVPSPVEDYAILAGLARQGYVWVTSKGSGITRIEDLWGSSREPALFGIQDVGGLSFVTAALGAHTLGIAIEYVAGYRGSRNRTLALMRGEIDLTSASFETLLDGIEAGDLVPLLQLSVHPISDHPALAGVPLLAGPDGLARERATALGRSPEIASGEAAALAQIVDVGAIIVAPAGIDDGLARCLGAKVIAAAEHPELVEAVREARRSLDVTRGAEITTILRDAVTTASDFKPVLEEALVRVRS